MDVNDHDFVLWPTFFFLIFFFKSNRCYNFWTTRDRAFLFHMYIPCDEAFLIVPKFLFCDLYRDLWPTFLKTFTLAITSVLYKKNVRDIDFIFAIHTKVIKPF